MKKHIRGHHDIIGGCMILMLFLLPAESWAQASDYAGIELGSPAYSYYLAESIIQSYQRLFQPRFSWRSRRKCRFVKNCCVPDKTRLLTGIVSEIMTQYPDKSPY